MGAFASSFPVKVGATLCAIIVLSHNAVLLYQIFATISDCANFG
jgi:hypothetical protein